MSSIKDVSLYDIELFLSKNGIKVPYNNDEKYKLAFNLIKNLQEYYPSSLVEWLYAYNLLKSKVNIPTYKKSTVLNLSEEELFKLSKLLNMKTINKNHIINILRYLHKLEDDTVSTLVGNLDVDILLLEAIDNKTLNSLEVNSYTQKILNSQDFWKKRLERRLGLFSDQKNLDYKFITKFLDNDKSFIKNYNDALRLYNENPSNKKFSQIIKIIKENNIKIHPDLLMNSDVNILILLSILIDEPYSFISTLRNLKFFKSEDLDEKIYAESTPRLLYPIDYENDEWEHIELNKGEYSAGELLEEYISRLLDHMPADREYFDIRLRNMYSDKTNFYGIKWSENLNAYYVILSD